MLMTREEIKAERLRTLASTYERADTTLAGRWVPVDVVSEDSIDAPAYSLGDHVFLNYNHIGEVASTDDIVKVTGLNFHELCHVLYTPGAQSWLVKTLRSEGLFDHFNMLEDQRIEGYFLTESAALKPYFVMAIMEYIAGPNGDLDTAHTLTHGRRYLPKDIRKALKKRFKFQQVRKQIEQVIDEFRFLVLPRDDARALALVRQFKKLLDDCGPQHKIDDPHSHGTRPQDNIQRKDTDQRRQEKASAQAADNDAEDEKSDAGKGDSKGGKGKPEPGEGEGDGQGSGDGPGDEQGKDEAPTPGKKGGDGSAEVNPSVETDESLKQKIEDAAKKSRSSSEVQRDANMRRQAINDTMGKLPRVPLEDYKECTVDSDYAFASVGFKKELGRLWVDSDPGWEPYQSSGRVNVARVMRGGDIDTVWDQWREGKLDATSIEVVVLVDYSYSMISQMDAVSQSLWAIKNAVEAVNGEVTVIGYENGAKVFYDKQTKAGRSTYRKFGHGGGTKPLKALNETRMLMHFSRKAHRMVIILTDGEWDKSTVHKCEQSLRLLEQHGVITALAFMDTDIADFNVLDAGRQRELNHGVQEFRHIKQPMDFVNLAKQIVLRGMASRV